MLTMLKPLIYFVLFLLATFRWYAPVKTHWWRPLVAALLRVAIGLLVGIPIGLFLNGQELGLASSAAIMLPIRFALWFGTTRLLYAAAPPKERLVFTLVATAVSFAIELIDTGGDGYQHALDTFRMC
jgi:hypothetical protein